jgi:hypothetical protein
VVFHLFFSFFGFFSFRNSIFLRHRQNFISRSPVVLAKPAERLQIGLKRSIHHVRISPTPTLSCIHSLIPNDELLIVRAEEKEKLI